MSNDLIASLVLKLDDQISGGVRIVADVIDRLRDTVQRVNFSPFGEGADQIERANAQTVELTESLSRVQRVAQSVGEALGRMGANARAGLQAGIEGIRSAGGGLFHSVNEFGEAGSNLINRGFGAAAEGFAIYEPIKRYADFENIVRHTGITEGRSGDDLNRRIAYLTRFIDQDALRTGQRSDSIATAIMELEQMGIRDNIETIIGAHSRAATAYNTTTEALGPAVGAIIQTLKVPADQLAVTMSAMAQASKEGRFKIENFSQELPGVAAQMALLGQTGRKAANNTFAALEVVMRGASQPSQAATNLTDLLQYIRSPFAARHFAKQGINLHDVLERGIHSGDILGAVMDAVQTKVKGADQAKFAEEFGKLFHNQQAGSALMTLLQQRQEFEHLRAMLNQVDAGVVNRDFISAFKSPEIQLEMMGIELDQVTRRLGEGFLPVLQGVNFALSYLNDGLQWALDNYPEYTHWILAIVAGLFAVGAALTLIGAVAPLVSAGFGVLLGTARLLLSVIMFIPTVLAEIAGVGVGVMSAILALAAVFAGAAIDIYEHWDRFRGFFIGIWDGVKQTLHGVGEFFVGIFTGDMHRAVAGLEQAWSGITKFFSNLWAAVTKIFMDFAAWVDSWTGGIFGKLNSAISAATSHFRPQGAGDWGSALASGGGGGAVQVHVTTDPGVNATVVRTSGNVSATTGPNTGATRTRP